MDIKSLARTYTERAVQALGGIVENSDSDASRVAAAIALLDRGWGKPNQPAEHKVEGSIDVVIRDLMAEKANKK